MNPINVYHYILPFLGSIIWLMPYIAKAARQSNITTSPTISNSSTNWHPYPRSIQLRSGLMVHNHLDRFTTPDQSAWSSKMPLVIIPTTIDVSILYVHPFFASQLESYPSIGLSFLFPYVLQKKPQLRCPNIWGILTYIELYQSHPTCSTWGHRISIGAIKSGTLVRATHQPNYSIVATKEITYHWSCTPSWQVNFGMGLLMNWWTKDMEDKRKGSQASTTDGLNTHKTRLNVVDNDASRLKFVPLATIGMRYITHTAPFLKWGSYPIHYGKRKRSRLDCSIAGSSRQLALTQKYHLIFRGSSLLSLAINTHNALLCALELGYNGYKKALLANMLSVGAIEVTTWCGYEIRYGRCVLQLQLGCEITDSKKPTIQACHADTLSNILYRRGSVSVNVQYMCTDHCFVGISTRSQETPALRLGISL